MALVAFSESWWNHYDTKKRGFPWRMVINLTSWGLRPALTTKHPWQDSQEMEEPWQQHIRHKVKIGVFFHPNPLLLVWLPAFSKVEMVLRSTESVTPQQIWCMPWLKCRTFTPIRWHRSCNSFVGLHFATSLHDSSLPICNATLATRHWCKSHLIGARDVWRHEMGSALGTPNGP